MTEKLEALSHRMATLQGIRGVVRTMKTLSAINAAPYERAVASIEAYHATILQGLQIFAGATRRFDVLAPNPRAPKIALFFGSDHGLCGGYNEIVASAGADWIAADDWHILAVGVQMEDALTGRGLLPIEVFSPPASADGMGRLAGEILVALDEIRDRARRGEITVTMVHMKHSGRVLQTPAITELLPLASGFLADLAVRPWKSRSVPCLTMDPEMIFAALVRNHLFASLFRASAEAMATENAARLALMQQAERAIDERYDELLLVIRSARQSEVTNEILDVISGFEALKQKTRPSVSKQRSRRG
jgi:F-type H+-transporting ATPase subunit gamma